MTDVGCSHNPGNDLIENMRPKYHQELEENF